MALICFLFFNTALLWAQEDPAGRIVRMEGKIEIIRDNNVLEGEAGLEVFQSDEINTGPKSVLELLMMDGSSLHLGPDSTLILKQYRFSLMEEKPSFISRLAKGFVVYISGAISKLHPEKVGFETPDGAVAVRGTKFFMRVLPSTPDNPGSTFLLLLMDPDGNVGQVIFTNSHGRVVLDKENFTVTVFKDKAPPESRFMDRQAQELLAPANLFPVIFENFIPPLAFTEAFEALIDQTDQPATRQKQDPYSKSTF